MKIYRKLILLSLALLCVNTITAQTLSATQAPSIKDNFELIESVPLNTIYGQPNVRHPETVWLDMLKEAKNTIDIGAFYFETAPQTPIVPFINAIKDAANRGVKVRIILDGSFYKNSQPAIMPLLNQANIEIRAIPMNKITGGIMHAKYMVIDNQDVFVGSQNFDWKAMDQIHEIGVRVRNQQLAETIAHVFNLDWQLCKTGNIGANQKLLFIDTKFNPVTAERQVIVNYENEPLLIHVAFSPKTLLPTGFDWEQQQFVDLLNNARHQVLMQVLTYSPDAGFNRKGDWLALDNAIRNAAGRGVKIKLIVSNWALTYPMINYLKSLSLVPNVEIKISSVPPYKNQFIPFARVEHCKYMVIDNDLSWIGTGNWQWSYFNNTRNIAIIINGQKPNAILQQIFFRDYNGPYTEFINVNKKYHKPKTH